MHTRAHDTYLCMWWQFDKIWVITLHNLYAFHICSKPSHLKFDHKYWKTSGGIKKAAKYTQRDPISYLYKNSVRQNGTHACTHTLHSLTKHIIHIMYTLHMREIAYFNAQSHFLCCVALSLLHFDLTHYSTS